MTGVGRFFSDEIQANQGLVLAKLLECQVRDWIMGK